MDHNVREAGRASLGRELVGHRPPHGSRGGAEGGPFGRAVDLDDDTVGVVIEAVPLLLPVLDVRFNLGDPAAQLETRTDGKAETTQPLERRHVAVLFVAIRTR